MKLKGSMLDADGHLIERDEELLEYMEAPYKGNNTLLGFPFFPTLDGYQRGAIMARLGIHKGYTINAKTWIDFLDGTGIESTVLYPTAGLAFNMIQDPTWAVPLARAYNNWFTDKFHKASPQRLKAVALVPIDGIRPGPPRLSARRRGFCRQTNGSPLVSRWMDGQVRTPSGLLPRALPSTVT